MSHLTQQLNTYLTQQANSCKSRRASEHRAQVDDRFKWAEQFCTRYLQSRETRGKEIGSDLMLQARSLARDVIGVGKHDFFATCIDGRCMPSVMFSKVPHEGGVLRAPAGIVLGFMDAATPQHVFIDTNSPVVEQIVKILLERPGETVYYSFDSHIGCAARGKMHTTEGGSEQDGGLKADIESKLMMARGVLQLRNDLAQSHTTVATVIPTFFSFDPHTGGCIFGLEAQLEHPLVQEQGMSPEVIKKLTQEKRVVQTLEMLHDATVTKQLASVIHPKSAQIRDQFAQTLHTNWKAISQLYDTGNGTLFLYCVELLQDAYTRSGWVVGDNDSLTNQAISLETIRQKAKLVLKNLVTRFALASDSPEWPFDHHQEEMIVITEGGYGPFSEIDAFAVFAKQDETPNVVLATDLIRSFRAQGAISDPTRHYKTPSEFVAAPIIISSKSIVKLKKAESWKALSQLDLSAFCASINWDSDTTYTQRESVFKKTLTQFVSSHTQITLPIGEFEKWCDGVWELYTRLKKYLSDKHVRKMILRGQLIVLHTVTDGDRQPQMIIPFSV